MRRGVAVSLPKGHTDHIISDRMGGSSRDRTNLMALCPPCHTVKSRMEQRGYRPAAVPGYMGLIPADRQAVLRDIIEAIDGPTDSDTTPKEWL